MRHQGARGWGGQALLAVASASAASGPTVSVGELRHCAAITAADERLACYDTLALSKAPAHAEPAVPAQPARSTAAASGPAAAASAPVAAAGVPAATAAGAAGAAHAAAQGTSGSFGMTPHAQAADADVQTITAHVVSASADSQGNVYVALDNGQTWAYQDWGGAPAVGAEMRIRRASLGSYMITTPLHHSFRAQRTK